MNRKFLFDVDLKESIVKLKNKWRQENMKYIYLNIRERSKWKVWQYGKLCRWMQLRKCHWNWKIPWILVNTFYYSKYNTGIFIWILVVIPVSRHFFLFHRCKLLNWNKYIHKFSGSSFGLSCSFHRVSTFSLFSPLYFGEKELVQVYEGMKVLVPV